MSLCTDDPDEAMSDALALVSGSVPVQSHQWLEVSVQFWRTNPFLPYVAPHSSHIPQIQFCFSLSWLEVSRIDFAEVPEGQGEKLK